MSTSLLKATTTNTYSAPHRYITWTHSMISLEMSDISCVWVILHRQIVVLYRQIHVLYCKAVFPQFILFWATGIREKWLHENNRRLCWCHMGSGRLHQWYHGGDWLGLRHSSWCWRGHLPVYRMGQASSSAWQKSKVRLIQLLDIDAVTVLIVSAWGPLFIWKGRKLKKITFLPRQIIECTCTSLLLTYLLCSGPSGSPPHRTPRHRSTVIIQNEGWLDGWLEVSKSFHSKDEESTKRNEFSLWLGLNFLGQRPPSRTPSRNCLS